MKDHRIPMADTPVTAETLNRYNDVFAKFILTDPGQEAVVDFLNAVFENEPSPVIEGKIVSVEFRDRETLPLGKDNKISRLDLFVVTDKGQPIDIEIQCYNDPYLEVRSLTYWASIVVRMMKQSRNYAKTKGAVVVSLMKLGKPMFGGEEGWHAVVETTFRRTKHLFSDMLNLHFVQPEFCPTINSKNKRRIHWWFDYFEHRNVEAFKAFAAHDEVFDKIMKSEEKFLSDMDRQVQYACMERDAWDRISAEDLRFNEGKAEGLAEGEAKKAKEIACSLLEVGMSIKQISEIIKLSPEETQVLLGQ